MKTDAEAAFADLFQELVGTDHVAGVFTNGSVIDGLDRAGRGGLQESARPGSGFEQFLHLG